MCAPPAESYAIEKVSIHPLYLECTDGCNKYDVAVLYTQQRVTLSQYIRPICLPAPSEITLRSIQLTVSGWGLTEETDSQTGQQANIQQYLENIRELEPGECGRRFPGDVKLCAGQRDGEAPCKGDSGSPLVHKIKDRWIFAEERKPDRYELVGIVNSGDIRCGGREAGYARVAHPNILNWIYSTTQLNIWPSLAYYTGS